MVNFYFIELAHEYTKQSHHVSNVTEIKMDEVNKKAVCSRRGPVYAAF